MTRYSDAALLKGDYAHLAAELRAGKRGGPTPADWQQAACDNAGEEVAQSVGRQIFALQETLDPEKERLVIHASTDVGTMVVLGLFPGDGDVLRLEGHLVDDTRPVALLLHASQLALTITKRPADEGEDEEDGARIGFVIFDALAKRAEEKAHPAISEDDNDKTTASKKAKSK